MGLFTAELYKAIEDHPEETITILFSVFLCNIFRSKTRF